MIIFLSHTYNLFVCTLLLMCTNNLGSPPFFKNPTVASSCQVLCWIEANWFNIWSLQLSLLSSFPFFPTLALTWDQWILLKMNEVSRMLMWYQFAVVWGSLGAGRRSEVKLRTAAVFLRTLMDIFKFITFSSGLCPFTNICRTDFRPMKTEIWESCPLLDDFIY